MNDIFEKTYLNIISEANNNDFLGKKIISEEFEIEILYNEDSEQLKNVLNKLKENIENSKKTTVKFTLESISQKFKAFESKIYKILNPEEFKKSEETKNKETNIEVKKEEEEEVED